jgi:hypothetical protein
MSKVTKALAVAIESDVPFVVIGEPGTGKTAIIEQDICPSIGYRCETVIASIRDVTDFLGLPIVSGDGVTYAPPSFYKRIINAENHGIPTFIFWDEVSTAPPSCQAGVLRIINERWIGDKQLPKSTRHGAAMNPTHTSAGGGELTAPMANRLVHLPWNVDVNEWIEWAIPRSPQHAIVAGFIKSKATALLQVPKNEADLGKAWPSPRTWDMLARLSSKSSGDTEIMLGAGCIGEGMAIEFFNWRQAQDLPNPWDLLKNPSSFKVPERGDTTFTVLASVANAAVSKMSKENYLAAWTIYQMAAKAGKKDIAAASVVTLVKGAVGKDFMTSKDVRDTMRPLMAPFIEIMTAAGLMKKVAE